MKTKTILIFLFICYSISCYDIYMTVDNLEYIQEMEQNPFAKAMMRWCGTDVFVGVKCFVTVLATQSITAVCLLPGVRKKHRTIIQWLLALWFVEQIFTLYVLMY